MSALASLVPLTDVDPAQTGEVIAGADELPLTVIVPVTTALLSHPVGLVNVIVYVPEVVGEPLIVRVFPTILDVTPVGRPVTFAAT